VSNVEKLVWDNLILLFSIDRIVKATTRGTEVWITRFTKVLFGNTFDPQRFLSTKFWGMAHIFAWVYIKYYKDRHIAMQH